jgi:hypothetical protein
MHDLAARANKASSPWLRWSVLLLLVAAALLGIARANVPDRGLHTTNAEVKR